MWAFVLLCAIAFIGLYLYHPQKVKQKLYEKSKSNSNYVFITFYFAIAVISLIVFAMLLINNIGSIVPRLGI